jgi:hypothetical protein
MTPDQKALWDRLESFEFDATAFVFPFAARLARDNRWGGGYTARVITEYWRFAYGCSRASGDAVRPGGSGLAPPHLVYAILLESLL